MSIVFTNIKLSFTSIINIKIN